MNNEILVAGTPQVSLRFGEPGVGHEEVAAFCRQVIIQYILPGSILLVTAYSLTWWSLGIPISSTPVLLLAMCGASYGLQRLGRANLAVANYLIGSYVVLAAHGTGLISNVNGLASGASHLMALYPLLIWVCSSRRWQRFLSVGLAVATVTLTYFVGQGSEDELVLPQHFLGLSLMRCYFMLATSTAVAHVFDISVELFAHRSKVALARLESTVSELDARALQLTQEAAAHRETMDSLRRSETRYRHLFDNAFDGIVISDGKAEKPLEINDTLANRLGCTPLEILDRSMVDMSPEFQADGTPTTVARDRLMEQVTRLGALRYPWRHITKQGELVDFEIHTVNLPGPDRIRVSMLRDVTDQLRAERELQDANRELRTFAHAASHDLKEPLRTMSTFAGLLARRYDGQLDAQGKQFLTFITDAAARGTRNEADKGSHDARCANDRERKEHGRLVLHVRTALRRARR